MAPCHVSNREISSYWRMLLQLPRAGNANRWAASPEERGIVIQKTFVPYVPFLNCGWKSAEDGCCSHPRNATPECHQFCCPIKAVAPPNTACNGRVALSPPQALSNPKKLSAMKKTFWKQPKDDWCPECQSTLISAFLGGKTVWVCAQCTLLELSRLTQR